MGTIFSLKTKIVPSKSHEKTIFLKIQSNHRFHLFSAYIALIFNYSEKFSILFWAVWKISLIFQKIHPVFKNFMKFLKFHIDKWQDR